VQHAVRLLLALAVLLGALPCFAQTEQTRIVLVARSGMDELAHRFVAELRSLRFDVVRAPDAEVAPSTAELESLAVSENARAAVRVEALESSVDLWLVNPQTHEVVYRRVVSDRDPAVAVLRALEILRGALIELQALQPEPPPPPARAPPAPPPSPPPPPEPSRWSLGLAGAALLPHAGSELAGALVLFGQYRFASRFGFDLEPFGSLHAFSIGGAGGRADVRLWGVLLGASVIPWGDSPFSPSLGLGWGGLGIWSQGSPAAGFQGSNNLAVVGFPHARVRFGVPVSSRSRVTAGLVAGFATPRPVLLFDQERDSNWLNPLLIASLGWEARFR
jgi:hypothetical protein